MMAYLFYPIIIVFVIYEISSFFNAEQRLETRNFLRSEKDVDKWTPTQGAEYIFQLFYMFTCFLGLITSQWLVFALVLVMGFIPKKAALTIRIDALATAILLLFAVLNRFHFHINIYNIIFK